MGLGASEAVAIAAAAHAGQEDKGRPLPYVTHPARVMGRFDDPELQVIAVLHDVVEDTVLTYDDLRAAGASERVVAAVDALTRRSDDEGDRYYQRVRANPDALAVKLGDLADNADPDRLDLLAPGDAARLRGKYAHALAVLDHDAAPGPGVPIRVEPRSVAWVEAKAGVPLDVVPGGVAVDVGLERWLVLPGDAEGRCMLEVYATALDRSRRATG